MEWDDYSDVIGIQTGQGGTRGREVYDDGLTGSPSKGQKSCKQGVLESMTWKLRIVSQVRDVKTGVLEMLQLLVIIEVEKR